MLLRVRLALRPSEVRGQDHRRALLEGIADRRQRRADARVVADRAFLIGTLKSTRMKRLLARELQVLDAP